LCLVSNVACFSGLFILDCSCLFLWIVHSWLLLSVSLDCSFLIAPACFSGLFILDCSCLFLWIVHSWLLLPVSLDCYSWLLLRFSLSFTDSYE
jgi:hypothetical protein